MSRYARRRDGNHADVLANFARLGCSVLDVASLPEAGCDAVVWRGDKMRLVEIKDPAQAPSKRKLTENEARMRLLHLRVHRIVATPDDVVAVAAELAPGSPVGHDRTRGQASGRPETSAAPRGAQEAR